MSPPFECSLGVEELAAVLNLAGKAEQARGLVAVTQASAEPDEARGRLTAAYHSLLARGLVEAAPGSFRLSHEFAPIVAALMESTQMLRAGRTGDLTEDILAFYGSGDAWVEHGIRLGVVHHFCAPVPARDVERRIMQFLSAMAPRRVEPIVIELPATLLTELAPEDRRSVKKVLASLQEASPADPHSHLLAEDFASGPWRGSMFYFARAGSGQVASRGVLWVQGNDRLWEISATQLGGKRTLQACLCSKRDLSEQVRGVVATALERSGTRAAG